jgi:hypothetical protein
MSGVADDGQTRGSGQDAGLFHRGVPDRLAAWNAL